MRSRWLARFSLAAAAAALLLSCNPLSLTLPDNAVDAPVVQHQAHSGTFTYTVDPGATPRDVYFVFTNPSMTANSAQKPSVQSAAIVIDGKSLPSPEPQPLYSENSEPRNLAERIAEFNRDPFKAVARGTSTAARSEFPVGPGEPSFDTEGAPGSFSDLGASGTTINVPATCQFVSPAPVTVADGTTRTLNVWVANDCWIGPPAGTKSFLIDTDMVTALANAFLKTGAENDIYDWVTAVIGAEWGDHGYTDLIAPNQEITILLSDIEEDDYPAPGEGRIVGYFWAGNNFTTADVPDSNERIMFVIDAVMYAALVSSRGETVWSTTNYWPKIVVSTLAHEFQHMIHFYQKGVVRGPGPTADAWINEMCSMIMEDLVSDKLGVEGPRGVSPTDGSAGSPGNTEGRIPLFNQYSSAYPLAVTSGYDLTDYSISYAFGSWLARNYGGTDLLRRIVQCPETNSAAVTNAAAADSGLQGESMAVLLEKWSASVLLSDMTTAPARYRYNTAGWTTSSAGGVSYNLGSINIFNYTPALYVFTQAGTVPGTVFNRSSNIYYQAALDLGAERSWEITVPQGILMTVVIK